MTQVSDISMSTPCFGSAALLTPCSCCKCPWAQHEPMGGTNVLLQLLSHCPAAGGCGAELTLASWCFRAVSGLSDPTALPAPIVSSSSITQREQKHLKFLTSFSSAVSRACVATARNGRAGTPVCPSGLRTFVSEISIGFTHRDFCTPFPLQLY